MVGNAVAVMGAVAVGGGGVAIESTAGADKAVAPQPIKAQHSRKNDEIRRICPRNKLIAEDYTSTITADKAESLALHLLPLRATIVCELVGYLLVRGGVHIVAYAKALEKLTGVDVGKLLPILDTSNKKFPEVRKHEEKGLHRILYRFSPSDYTQIGEIWNGLHPEDGTELTVQDGPPEGAPVPDLPEEPQLNSPAVDPDLFNSIASKLFGSNSPSK